MKALINRRRVAVSRQSGESTTADSAAKGRHHRAGTVYLKVCVLVLIALAKTAYAGTLGFDHYPLATSANEKETLLTGFFLGGTVAEVAVVHVDHMGQRRLRIHAFGDGSWQPAVDATLERGVLFMDVVNVGGRDRLLTISRKGLRWFDPDSGTERPLVHLSVPALHGIDGEVVVVDLVRDVNADGLDDLVVPTPDGFWIATQMPHGTFAEPVRLGPPEPFRNQTPFDDTRPYGETGITPTTIPWYMSRVHELDQDHDGRQDLAFWNVDHFDVHRQTADGRFEAQPKSLRPDVAFESDGAYTLAFGFLDESTISLLFGLRRKTSRTVLRLMGDLDGDGVADLLTHSLQGRSVIRLRSRYAMHLGARRDDSTVFTTEPNVVVNSPGWGGGLTPAGYSWLTIRDFDADGDKDMMVGNVKMGVTKIVRAMAGNSVTMDLEFYRMEGGVYPQRPTTIHKIRPAIRLFGKDPFFPPVLLGDIDGDGYTDLIRGESRRELLVFAGAATPSLFAPHPQTVTVVLPKDERNMRMVDLNKDGKEDILVHRRTSTAQPRATLLVAR